jgi:hypothetical protein
MSTEFLTCYRMHSLKIKHHVIEILLPFLKLERTFTNLLKPTYIRTSTQKAVICLPKFGRSSSMF